MTPRTLPEKDLYKFTEREARSAALQVYDNNHCNAADTVEGTIMETSTSPKIKALTVYVMNVSVQRGQPVCVTPRACATGGPEAVVGANRAIIWIAAVHIRI